MDNNQTPKPYQRDWNWAGHKQDAIARHIMSITFSGMYFVYQVYDVDNDMVYRNADIDLLVVKNNLVGGAYEPVSSIEIKADTYGYVQGKKYIFVETVSNDSKGTQGWIYTTAAEYILYYFILLDQYIMVKTSILRSAVEQADARGYKRRKANTYSPDNRRLIYSSHGVLVPVDDILQDCYCQRMMYPKITVEQAAQELSIPLKPIIKQY